MKMLPTIPEFVRRLQAGGLVVASACLVASCASLSSQHTQYVGAPRPPAADPAGVTILRTEPTRPHDRLGEVMVDATTDPAPPIEKVEEKLRQEAAKLGADAVVVVHDKIQPTAVYVMGGWWNRSVQTVTGRKLIGVAIKYKP